MIRVESSQADFERKAGDTLGLAASLSGGGAGRGGNKKGKRHRGGQSIDVASKGEHTTVNSCGQSTLRA